MVFTLAIFLLSTAGLFIATYTDFKERIVSNRLNLSMLGAGLVIHALYSFYIGSAWPAMLSIAGGALGFALGYALYRAGVWAGGDVKLLAALGALNPVNPFLLGTLLPGLPAVLAPVQLPIFPVTLFIFSLFSMFPVAMLLSLKKILKKKKLREELLTGAKKSLGLKSIGFAAFAVGLNAFLPAVALRWALILALLFGFGLLGKNKWKYAAAALAFAFALVQSPESALVEFIALYVSLVLLWNAFALIPLSRKALRAKKKAGELEEGMIPAETIVMAKGKARRIAPPSMKRIINYLKHYRLGELNRELLSGDNEIVSSKKARGLSLEEIKRLKKLVKEKKLDDGFYVKESAPMVPAVLVAYIALNIVGDILWNLVL